jgi:hypothetical protein
VSLGNTTYLYRVGMTLECEEAGERRKFQVDRDGTSLDERIGDFASNDADLTRVPTLLNAESRGIHERVCLRRSRWQVEVERRASSVVGCGPQSATMRFHDGTADR